MLWCSIHARVSYTLDAKPVAAVAQKSAHSSHASGSLLPAFFRAAGAAYLATEHGGTLGKTFRVLFVRHAELVAHAGLGQDIARLGRLRLDLFAQLIDEHPQIHDLVAIVRPPYGLQQLAMRNGSVGIA